MKVLLRRDSFVMWWALLTGSAILFAAGQLGGTLNGLREFLRGPYFSPEQFPATRLLAGLDWMIKQLFRFFVQTFNYDPSKPILEFRGLPILNWFVLILVIGILGYFIFRLYRRAQATKGFVDDILIFLLFLTLLGLILEILNLYKVPYAKEPWVKNLTILVFLGLTVVFGKKEVLNQLDQGLRVLGQMVIIAFLLWPQETANLLDWLCGFLTGLGQEIIQVRTPTAGIWFGLLWLYVIWLWSQGHIGRRHRSPASTSREEFEGF